MTAVIGIVVILMTMGVGGVFAIAFTGFGKSIQQNENAIVENERTKNSRFNPAVTMGFEIPYKDEAETQVKAARVLAAKQAASMPRGANANIGSLGNPTFSPLAESLEKDPWSASKIAQFHAWEGAKSGYVLGGTTAPIAGADPVAATNIKPPTLIELTDSMSGTEKRTARISNMKAKSAYKKALKAING